MNKIIDYRTLNLNSLDVLLCSGNGKLSEHIKWLQRLKGIDSPAANVSHAAAVIKWPFKAINDIACGNKGLAGLACYFDNDDLYVTETTTLNKWAGKKGLQTNGFGDWLENYNGEVYVRKLDFERTEGFQNKLIGFIIQHLKDPKASKYENGIPGLLELFLCEIGIKTAILNTAELHCTEWDSELLKEFKLLADVISNNRMPPFEFWPKICRNTKDAARCRNSLLDQNILVPISEPIRIK